MIKVKVFVTQSCPTLCNHMNCSTPGFSVNGLLQARILEWGAIAFSDKPSLGGNEKKFWRWRLMMITYWVNVVYATELYTKLLQWWILLYFCCCCSVTKLCLTLWDPMDCNPPGFPGHGISQTRTLEWVAISSSRGSSWPRDQTPASCIGRWILYHWAARKAPYIFYYKASKL